MIASTKPFRKNYHDSNVKLQQLSSTLKIDAVNHPHSVSNRFKSTSESPFPRKIHKNSLKGNITQQLSSKDLGKNEKKPTETPVKSLRTTSQKGRTATSLSPSTQLNIKESNKFLNPIEEILPRGVVNLKKKKVQKKAPAPKIVKPAEREKLETGLIFIAKNMKIVEDKFKMRENLKKKEPVFLSQTQTIFKYVLGGGNNVELVKRVLGKRDHWEETTSANTLFNFKWKQDNKGYHYERVIPDGVCRQLLNHFEFHKEISTKSGLVENLAQYCDQNRIELFDLTPITFVLDLDKEDCDINFQNFVQFYMSNLPKELESLKKPIFEVRKRFRSYIPMPAYDKKGIFGNSIYTKPKMKPIYMNSGSYLWLLKPTGFNRGRGVEIFTTLDQLEKYINEYYEGVVEKSLKQPANANPEEKKDEEEKETTIVTKDGAIANKENNEEIIASKDSKKEIIEPLKIIETPNSKKNNTIINTVNNKAKEIKAPVDPNDYIRLSLQNMPNVIKSHTFVIQKYIEKPLLVKARKFDIRVWAMVSHTLEVYFFKEGYLRTSSEEFNIGNTDNYFIHLTNNAVQKYSTNYGQFENGNQLSFPWFQKFLEEMYPGFDFKGKILGRIKELIFTSMNAVKKKLNPNDRKHCFEVFGYDFIIDENLHVWLIEVNTNPCLEESSPLLAMLIPRMIDDAFKLTLDVLFPKRDPQPPKPKAQTLIPQKTAPVAIVTEEKTKPNSTVDLKEPTNLQPKTMGGTEQEIQLEPDSTTTTTNTTTIKNEAGKVEETPIIEKKAGFRGSIKEKNPSPFPVKGYSDEENMWEILGPKPVEKTPAKTANSKRN